MSTPATEATSSIRVSILICTYNRSNLLANCLASVAGQMDGYENSTEVIVVDNNCVDDTSSLLTRYASEHSWFRAVREERQGLSHARNRGALEARGEYLCYLDDDAKAGPDYVRNLHAVIDKHRPDIFGGPVYPYYTTRKPAWFQDSFEIRRHADSSGFAQCSISGGNFVIRATLLRELGMFSPELGMVGSKVRLGEERAVLEMYRRGRAKSDQRVYYSLECFILHHVPPQKMKARYFLKRGFQAGRANVMAKKEPLRNVPHLVRKFGRTFFLETVLRKPPRNGKQESLVMGLQRSALMLGKLTKHAENAWDRVPPLFRAGVRRAKRAVEMESGRAVLVLCDPQDRSEDVEHIRAALRRASLEWEERRSIVRSDCYWALVTPWGTEVARCLVDDRQGNNQILAGEVCDAVRMFYAESKPILAPCTGLALAVTALSGVIEEARLARSRQLESGLTLFPGARIVTTSQSLLDADRGEIERILASALQHLRGLQGNVEDDVLSSS